MKLKYLLLISLISVLLASFTMIMAQSDEQQGEDEKPHWTYEGEAGPENWGNLAEEYAICGTGTAQSPINILAEEIIEVDLTNIQFNYGTTALNIKNNGHTIEVEVDENSSTISYNGVVYNLKQFHFHTPSEHTVNGEHALMEVHFVHEDPLTQNLAVVGVFIMMDEADNASYADIFANLPAEESEVKIDGITLDLNSLMPETRTYLTYQGSLTTPPCTQKVRWLVLGDTLYFSEAQIASFQAIFPLNARRTQDQNDRDILVDVTE